MHGRSVKYVHGPVKYLYGPVKYLYGSVKYLYRTMLMMLLIKYYYMVPSVVQHSIDMYGVVLYM